MKPLIGVTGARDVLKRRHALPVFLYNRSYVRAVELAGAAPICVPLDLEEETLQAIFRRLDGLLLSGGGDVVPALYDEEPHPLLRSTDPERDRVEGLLTRWALADRLPLLAICRGIQMLNVAAGGSLYQDVQAQCPAAAKHDYLPPDFERTRLSHHVVTEPGSRIAHIVGHEVPVNSLHHQAVRRVAPGFVVTARAEDGVIEAIEQPDHPYALGVQWHPEELVPEKPVMCRLFESFVESARDHWAGGG